MQPYKENPKRVTQNRTHKTRPASRNTTTTIGEIEDSNSQILY